MKLLSLYIIINIYIISNRKHHQNRQKLPPNPNFIMNQVLEETEIINKLCSILKGAYIDFTNEVINISVNVSKNKEFLHYYHLSNIVDILNLFQTIYDNIKANNNFNNILNQLVDEYDEGDIKVIYTILNEKIINKSLNYDFKGLAELVIGIVNNINYI